MTDGFIPEQAVKALAPGMSGRAKAEAIERLVETQAWERRNGGYFVHDYLQYQDSADEVRRVREAGKKRAKDWRASRGTNAERTALRGGDKGHRNAVRTPVVTQPTDRTGAVTPHTVPPTSSDTAAQRRYDWPSPEVKAASVQPDHPLFSYWLPGRHPYEAFHHDCPARTWRGKCVDQAWLTAHPGEPYAVDAKGQPKQCPVHVQTSAAPEVKEAW